MPLEPSEGSERVTKDVLPSLQLATPNRYVLHLFVSGHTVATERTLQTLHELLERSLGYSYTLRVIDILKHPEKAESYHISATPTLIRVLPLPARRIVGNLEDFDKVLQVLVASERE